MKRTCKYLLTGCVLIGLTACQKQAITPPPSVSASEEECVYMSLALAFSSNSGTRSATQTPDGGGYVTSDDGTESGKESETGIAEILLVLADAENRNIAAGLLEEATPTTGSNTNYVISVPFRFVKDHTGETLNVYCSATLRTN